MRAGSSVLGRLKPVSKPFDHVSHVAFAIWFVLARSSRVAVSPRRHYPKARARTLRPAKDRLEIFDSFQLLFAYGAAQLDKTST
jgi:hypothetical protein